MQLLVALAQAEGQAVSRDELLTRCWEGVIVSDHAINRVIARLRKTLQAAGGGFRIETLPKVGYRLVRAAPAEADVLEQPNPTITSPPAEVPRQQPPAKPVALRNSAFTAAAALLALIAFGLFIASRSERGERWAVLPFATEADPSLVPFAQSLAAKIRGSLAGSGFAPAAHIDAARFRSGGMKLAAKREGVEFIVDGTVRREAGSMSVEIQVIDALANQIVWSKSFRRDTAEAAFLEEQIAAHAADILRCALVSRKPRGVRLDPETAGVFLRACDQVQRFDGGRANLLTAGRMLTDRAPEFSRGWSMLALASAYASRGAAGSERFKLQSSAEDAAARAIALDPLNGEAYLARAVALPLLGVWGERETLIGEALAREPASVEAHLIHSELLAEQGRIEAAMEANDRALAIEPLSPVALAARIRLALTLGQATEVKALREGLYRTWPSAPSAIFNRFNSLLYNGEHEDALAMLAGGALPEMPLFRAFLEASVAGDAPAREQSVRAVVEAAGAGKFDKPPAIALAAYAGFLDEAFALADAHYAQVITSEPIAGAGRWVIFVKSTASMRRDPRFAALVTRLGLTERWRTSGRSADTCRADPANCGLL